MQDFNLGYEQALADIQQKIGQVDDTYNDLTERFAQRVHQHQEMCSLLSKAIEEAEDGRNKDVLCRQLREERRSFNWLKQSLKECEHKRNRAYRDLDELKGMSEKMKMKKFTPKPHPVDPCLDFSFWACVFIINFVLAGLIYAHKQS